MRRHLLSVFLYLLMPAGLPTYDPSPVTVRCFADVCTFCSAAESAEGRLTVFARRAHKHAHTADAHPLSADAYRCVRLPDRNQRFYDKRLRRLAAQRIDYTSSWQRNVAPRQVSANCCCRRESRVEGCGASVVIGPSQLSETLITINCFALITVSWRRPPHWGMSQVVLSRPRVRIPLGDVTSGSIMFWGLPFQLSKEQRFGFTSGVWPEPRLKKTIVILI